MEVVVGCGEADTVVSHTVFRHTRLRHTESGRSAKVRWIFMAVRNNQSGAGQTVKGGKAKMRDSSVRAEFWNGAGNGLADPCSGTRTQNVTRTANCISRSENWRVCAPCEVPVEEPLPSCMPV